MGRRKCWGIYVHIFLSCMFAFDGGIVYANHEGRCRMTPIQEHCSVERFECNGHLPAARFWPGKPQIQNVSLSCTAGFRLTFDLPQDASRFYLKGVYLHLKGLSQLNRDVLCLKFNLNNVNWTGTPQKVVIHYDRRLNDTKLVKRGLTYQLMLRALPVGEYWIGSGTEFVDRKVLRMSGCGPIGGPGAWKTHIHVKRIHGSDLLVSFKLAPPKYNFMIYRVILENTIARRYFETMVKPPSNFTVFMNVTTGIYRVKVQPVAESCWTETRRSCTLTYTRPFPFRPDNVHDVPPNSSRSEGVTISVAIPHLSSSSRWEVVPGNELFVGVICAGVALSICGVIILAVIIHKLYRSRVDRNTIARLLICNDAPTGGVNHLVASLPSDRFQCSILEDRPVTLFFRLWLIVTLYNCHAILLIKNQVIDERIFRKNCSLATMTWAALSRALALIHASNRLLSKSILVKLLDNSGSIEWAECRKTRFHLNESLDLIGILNDVIYTNPNYGWNSDDVENNTELRSLTSVNDEQTT